MTKTVSAFSKQASARECAKEIAASIREGIGGPPDALIVFASPKVGIGELLSELWTSCSPANLIGCSSAGEFAEADLSEGAVSALAIKSDEIQFKVCTGTGIRADVQKAAADFCECLGQRSFNFKYRYILLLADALAGHTEEFILKVNELTAGAYQLFGGGAGDDAKFEHTQVFSGDEPVNDAAVGLAIYSNKPFGIGVRHGWEPASEGMRATEVEGFELVSLNAEAAQQVIVRRAREAGQHLDVASPLPYFLHNVLGVASPAGFKIRVPLGFTERGGIICATEIPAGSTVHVMKTTRYSAELAAGEATDTAMAQIGKREPAGVIFFDCVATRLRLGTQFGSELAAVREKTAPAPFVGCNSYGQVARVDGQFSAFHNCTAVVCVIPS
jgi:hypothetical protein